MRGFLEIVQAAQTAALARVLDDRLTRYLGRLLDENLQAEEDAASAHPFVQRIPLRARAGRTKSHRRGE